MLGPPFLRIHLQIHPHRSRPHPLPTGRQRVPPRKSRRAVPVPPHDSPLALAIEQHYIAYAPYALLSRLLGDTNLTVAHTPHQPHTPDDRPAVNQQADDLLRVTISYLARNNLILHPTKFVARTKGAAPAHTLGPQGPALNIVEATTHLGVVLKKTCVAGLGTRKMGDSGPPPLNNAHFLPKNGLKMPILGQKQCTLGSGGHLKAPTLFYRCSTHKNMNGRLWKPENGCFRTPSLKNGNFLLKNGLKMPILDKKTLFFWARVVNSSTPPPYLQVLHSNNHVLQSNGSSKYVFQGRRDLRKAFTCQKMA